MILGIGHDLVQIPRIESVLKKHEQRFLRKYFQDCEILKNPVASLHQKACHYAKRFAAKEACAKAFGMGFRGNITMRDITIQNDKIGKPVLHFSNGALTHLQSITPTDKQWVAHISLSDDMPLASAYVVIEAV